MKTKKAKQKIFHSEWQKIHPFSRQASSDFYFVNLANRFLEMVEQVYKNTVSEKTKKNIALSIAAYFEDVISEFGLWQGFTRKHFKMYGKYLPFYEFSENYIPEEINLEDILFIIWSVIQLEMRETKIMINKK